MEIWKKIEGYEYFINPEGLVKDAKGNLIKPWYLRQGYKQIGLTRNKVRTKYLVHRLVAKAYIENPENKDFVNHKNLIKDDNRKENLEWVSKEENIEHFLSLNKQTRSSYEEGFKFEVANFSGSMLESVRFYNVPTSTVQRWRKELRVL